MGFFSTVLAKLGIGSDSVAAAQTPTAAPGLASMLDLNGDGNPLDDIVRMAGKMLR